MSVFGLNDIMRLLYQQEREYGVITSKSIIYEMRMKNVSIIMAIYNCESTLDEAIQSIINQTYQNWELILCDDGSKDNTYNMALMYSEQFSNIRVYRNDQNMGLNYSLNKCLQYAKGEYIARMDGDDISLPDRIEKEVAFLDQNLEYAIVSSPMQYFDENGVFRTGKGKGEPNIENFAKGTPFCHAPCMVRREAYEAVNGYSESPQRLRVEDWDLWIKMYTKGYRGYVLDTPLYMMRDDRNAYSRRKFKYRVNEARISCMAVRELRLQKKYYIYALRPIIVGLMPKALYMYLHRKRV